MNAIVYHLFLFPYLYLMPFILPAVYAFIFIFLIFKMRFFENAFLSRGRLVLLFLLKLAVAAVVWIIYSCYYSGADFFTYFTDSSVLIHNLFHADHQQYSTAWTGGSFDNSMLNSSRFMIIMNAGLQLFSFGNFYVHGVFFCFLSFAGTVALLKAFSKHFPSKRNILIALFFVPSILFWTSAPLKEAIVMGLAGLLVFLTDFGLRRQFSRRAGVLVAVLVLLLILVKIYVLFAFLPVLMVNQLMARSAGKTIILYYLLVAGSLALILTAAAYASPRLNVLRIISDKQAKAISEAKGGVFLASDVHFISISVDQEKEALIAQPDSSYKIKDGSTYLMWVQNNMSDTLFVSNSKDTSSYRLLYRVIPAGSVISIKKLKPKVAEFLLYAPVAFLSTLLHPMFSEIRSWLHMAVAIENIWILLLIILSACFFDRSVLEKKEILLFCLVFVVLLFVLIGITTPAMGAMIRYRTIGLQFLSVICFLVLDEEKMKRKLFPK